MANPTNKYITNLGLQQPSASDLTDGTTGSGAVVEAGSPALSGTPTAPTAAPGTNTTQLATTAFVNANSSPTDVLKVNGSTVVTPFSFTALVNGIGPVGETKVNGLPVANYRPCMVDNSFNLQPRTTGVVYQNTSPYPIYVSAALVTSVAGTTVTAFADLSSSPTTQVWTGITGTGNLQNPVFFVPAGGYYKITISAGTITVNGWREFICQNGTITDSGDIHGSRSLSTVFQNNTPNTLFVAVQVTGVSAGNVVQAVSDPVAIPTSVVDSWGQPSGGSGPVTLFFIVPPGHYYKVTAASGSISLWHEYSWNISCQRSLDLMIAGPAGAPRIQTSFTRVSSSAVTVTSASLVQNIDPFRVRWVAILNSSSAAVATTQFFTGDNVPPLTQLFFSSPQQANAPKGAKGPVMPLQYYQMAETIGSANTLANTHWWEYQLG